jgi:hypothetical protein
MVGERPLHRDDASGGSDRVGPRISANGSGRARQRGSAAVDSPMAELHTRVCAPLPERRHTSFERAAPHFQRGRARLDSLLPRIADEM